jgi:hypothetical protein
MAAASVRDQWRGGHASIPTALIAFGDWGEWAALVMGVWLVVSPWVLAFPPGRHENPSPLAWSSPIWPGSALAHHR